MMSASLVARDPAALKAERIAALSKMVYDDRYLKNAIQRMAVVMSRQLVEDDEEVKQW
jgi:hypothetical protein